MSNVHHLNATPEDFLGNGMIGRYVLLPGSDGRAERIAGRLEDVSVKASDRRLNCYFGSLRTAVRPLDVAVVSTGMGCPSVDIVLTELLSLGARRFLRLGTAGSLQNGIVNYGDLVIATGAVRDEGTSRHYAPIEFPALADLDVVAALKAAVQSQDAVRAHAGVVHCKDSLYAREFGHGPMADQNQSYMRVLTQCGTLASEMETAQLFIRSQLEVQAGRAAGFAGERVKSGALLAIIGDSEPFSARSHEVVMNMLIETGLRAVAELAQRELGAP
jgi:uridine phosphorylase